MRLEYIDPRNPDPARIAEAGAILRGGGLVVFPTETVYGLGALAASYEAQQRVFQVKGRDSNKPLTRMAVSAKEVVTTDQTSKIVLEQLGQKFWPGPLTLVVKNNENWHGYRIPNHPVALALLREVGELLMVTSANLSGQPPACTGREATEALGNRVDLVLDAGEITGGVPSSVVRIDAGRLSMLREGALSEVEIRRTLGE